MTNESDMDVFYRWLLTEDREEHIELTPIIFPGTSREEAEKMADEVEW